MPEPFLRFAAALLALTFAWAALAKLVRWGHWREALRVYDLPAPVAALAAPGVPLLEAAASALAIAGATHAAGALTVVLLSSFSGALLHAQARHAGRLPCGCFGRATTRDYRVMLMRNGLLAVVAASLLVATRDVSFLRDLSMPSADDLVPVALVIAGIGLCAWIAWHAASLFGRKQSP
jgi:Methylamine utilisation protein MauE